MTDITSVRLWRVNDWLAAAIPWEWIVDETRAIEKVASWDDPEHYASSVARSYRRDFWNQQPVRVEVWSEKGTVRGVLAPVLNDYGVGFLSVHGFNSATSVYDVSQSDSERDLIVLYVGDYDPSGLYMSEEDLPKRLEEYGGHHVQIRRIALTGAHTLNLPSFPAADKRKDPRHGWFVRSHGERCWELDAMDPNDLRTCVQDRGVDRARGVEAVRYRQPGGAGVAQERHGRVAQAFAQAAEARGLGRGGPDPPQTWREVTMDYFYPDLPDGTFVGDSHVVVMDFGDRAYALLPMSRNAQSIIENMDPTLKFFGAGSGSNRRPAALVPLCCDECLKNYCDRLRAAGLVVHLDPLPLH
jgi:hypothetical protein